MSRKVRGGMIEMRTCRAAVGRWAGWLRCERRLGQQHLTIVLVLILEPSMCRRRSCYSWSRIELRHCKSRHILNLPVVLFFLPPISLRGPGRHRRRRRTQSGCLHGMELLERLSGVHRHSWLRLFCEARRGGGRQLRPKRLHACPLARPLTSLHIRRPRRLGSGSDSGRSCRCIRMKRSARTSQRHARRWKGKREGGGPRGERRRGGGGGRGGRKGRG